MLERAANYPEYQLCYKCLLVMLSTPGLSGIEACLCSVQKSILELFPKFFPFLASLADYDTLEVLYNV